MVETLQRNDDGDNDLNGIADWAEAYANNLEIIDVSGGIAHIERDANFPYSLMPAAGRLAIRGRMPPFNQPF